MPKAMGHRLSTFNIAKIKTNNYHQQPLSLLKRKDSSASKSRKGIISAKSFINSISFKKIFTLPPPTFFFLSFWHFI